MVNLVSFWIEKLAPTPEQHDRRLRERLDWACDGAAAVRERVYTPTRTQGYWRSDAANGKYASTVRVEEERRRSRSPGQLALDELEAMMRTSRESLGTNRQPATP